MDVKQLDTATLITESTVIAEDSLGRFNRQLAEALTNGWSQYGSVTVVGTRFVVNVVKFDPRYTKLVNTVLTVATLQLESLGAM